MKVEVNEENNTLSAKIFNHREEIHHLRSSPNDKLIASVYTSTHKKSTELVMQSAILRIPDTSEMLSKETLDFADVEVLDTEPYGNEIKTTEFHPSSDQIASIVDGKIIIFNRAEAKSIVIAGGILIN